MENVLKDSQQRENLVVLIKTEKDLKKLENLLNSGYEIKSISHHQRDNGMTQTYWILGRPENKSLVQQPKEIESFRVLNPRSEDCQKETESLQKQGFKVDSVTPSSAILIKYQEVKK